MKIIEYIGRIVHPIGSIYCTESNINPGDFWGGTWEKWEDCFLLGASSTYPVGSSGGSNNAVVVSHTHTTEPHGHDASSTASTGDNWNFFAYEPGAGALKGRIINNGEGLEHMFSARADVDDLDWASGGIAAASMSFASRGSSATNANMPPYKNVYMWHRLS